MHLKNIWYSVIKADIIPLLILPLNKVKILNIINILHYLVKHLGLISIVNDKIMPIKRNYLTIKNITCAIYQKQDKLKTFYKYSLLKPILRLFHLQINLFRLFYITF